MSYCGANWFHEVIGGVLGVLVGVVALSVLMMAVGGSPKDEQMELMKLLAYEDEQRNLNNKPSDPSWNT